MRKSKKRSPKKSLDADHAARLLRMLCILRDLEETEWAIRADVWAEEFNVCIKTIKRDINFLRLHLDAHIVYEAASRGYVLKGAIKRP